MKAIVYRQYGGPEVLQLAEVDRPPIKPTELLIRVHACEVTKGDCELRAMRFPVQWFVWPLRLALGWRRPRQPILGGYFAGVVEQVGKQVSRFQPGDRVVGSTGIRMGAYGEYLAMPESGCVTHTPANVSDTEAAAAVLGGLNAMHFMNLAAIGQGEKVLINGAGGSIGLLAVQIARHLGAEVTAVDAAHKATLLRLHGAEHFIDYQEEDYTARGERYHVIFDMVAKTRYRQALNCLYDDGRYLSGNPRLSLMLSSGLRNLLSARQIYWQLAAEGVAELQDLMVQLNQGQLQAQVDQIFPLAEVRAAHERVESEQRLGAVVLDLTSG